MPFAPGTSGNPKGRPPKARALTEILQKASEKRLPIGKVNKNGKPVTASRKQVLANMLWSAATTGEFLLPCEYGPQRCIRLDGSDWFDVVKFLYTQIDGPPKVGLFDVPEDRDIQINFVKVEGRKVKPPEPIPADAEDE